MDWNTLLTELEVAAPGLAVHASSQLAGRDLRLLGQTARELVAAARERGARRLELTLDCINGGVFVRLSDDGAPVAGGAPVAARAAIRQAGGDLRVERSDARGVAVVFFWLAAAGGAHDADAA